MSRLFDSPPMRKSGRYCVQLGQITTSPKRTDSAGVFSILRFFRVHLCGWWVCVGVVGVPADIKRI